MVHQWGFFGSISAIRKIWSLTANSRSLQAAALNVFSQTPNGNGNFNVIFWQGQNSHGNVQSQILHEQNDQGNFNVIFWQAQ